MAEFSLIVVPDAPESAPPAPALRAASELLESWFPDSDGGVASRSWEVPRLVTALDGFEWLSCPRCRARVGPYENGGSAGPWWLEFLETMEHSSAPMQEPLRMPCCGAGVVAGEVDFGKDAAFARVELSIYEPGDEAELTSAQVSELGAVLGCPVRTLVGVYSQEAALFLASYAQKHYPAAQTLKQAFAIAFQ